MWPPSRADLPGFCPLFASPPEVFGKLRRETRLSGRRPRSLARIAERSTRASEVRRFRPSTRARRIAALAKTGNSKASPPELPRVAGNGCNSGSRSSPLFRQPKNAPRFPHSSGRPTRISLLHRPRNGTSCPFRSSSFWQKSLFRRPGLLPPSASSARVQRMALFGSSETYPRPSEVLLQSVHPIAVRMS